MGIWVRMCADGDVALGPLSDGLARDRYGLSGKHLRNIRHAATSGVLRRRAAELGVAVPTGCVDNPAGGRINGREMSVVPGTGAGEDMGQD